MSYVTVYLIHKSGDVVHLGTARNNHGFAPHVWRVLAAKTGTTDPMQSLHFEGARRKEAEQRFWGLFNSGKLSERDNIVLGATYDRVYIAQDNLQKVVDALRSFHMEHCQDVVETILGMAEILEAAIPQKSARGVCFNACSANENPWQIGWSKLSIAEKHELLVAWKASPEAAQDETSDLDLDAYGPPTYEARPFNFDEDVGKRRVLKGEPWELFDVAAYAADTASE